jgi:hypothetical protein
MDMEFDHSEFGEVVKSDASMIAGRSAPLVTGLLLSGPPGGGAARRD